MLALNPSEAKAIPTDWWSITKNALAYGLADIPDLAYQAMQGPWAPMRIPPTWSPAPMQDYLTQQGVLKQEITPSPKDIPSHYLDVVARMAPSLLLPLPGTTSAKVVGGLGREAAEAGAGRVPWQAQRGAIGDLETAAARGSEPEITVRNVGWGPEAEDALQRRITEGRRRLAESQGTAVAPARTFATIDSDLAALRVHPEFGSNPALGQQYDALIAERKAAEQAVASPPMQPLEEQAEARAARARAALEPNLADLEGQLLDAAERVRATRLGSPERDAAVERLASLRQARIDAKAAQERAAGYGTPAEQAKVQTLFKGLAKRPESFQFGGQKPTPKTANLNELASYYSTDKNPMSATQKGGIITITNDRTGGYINIHDADTPHPYIRSTGAESQGQEQAGGKQMYAVANSWLARKGKTLVPDVSISAINKYRKTESAISSYLRHGKEGYIDLSNATQARNLKELLMHSHNYVRDTRPDLMDAFAFDGTEFLRGGKPIAKGEINAAIAEKDPGFSKGIGETSLKRALMTRWAMGAPRRQVIETAKKFKEPTLYALGVLTAGKIARESAGTEGD